MIGINGHNLNTDLAVGRRREEREGDPFSKVEDAEEREGEAGELEGEEFGGGA